MILAFWLKIFQRFDATKNIPLASKFSMVKPLCFWEDKANEKMCLVRRHLLSEAPYISGKTGKDIQSPFSLPDCTKYLM